RFVDQVAIRTYDHPVISHESSDGLRVILDEGPRPLVLDRVEFFFRLGLRAGVLLRIAAGACREKPDQDDTRTQRAEHGRSTKHWTPPRATHPSSPSCTAAASRRTTRPRCGARCSSGGRTDRAGFPTAHRRTGPEERARSPPQQWR